MAPEPRRRNSQAISAEISLTHLKNCLVNLPSSLYALLVNLNMVCFPSPNFFSNLLSSFLPAQNIIVELSYRLPTQSGSDTKGSPFYRSIFAGWTGMQSKRKLAAIVDRDGIIGVRGKPQVRDQEVPLVEVDATFARTLGILDGQKVTASLHMDPPMAHTIHIEPSSPEDWEIIELHANFLELNFVNQIRALPNPSFISPDGSAQTRHPLTLHLSPTSTANMIVTSLEPPTASTSPFAKLDPGGEVIVAPKSRSKPLRSSGENRSITSRRSAGGRSGTSTIRRKSGREQTVPARYFRGLDRRILGDYFDTGKEMENQGLKVWVDRDIVLSTALKGVTWVCITVIKPMSLQNPIDPQKQQQEIERVASAGKPASKVVARLTAWDNAPDSHHIALSSALCASLSCDGLVGGLVKLEPAPAQIAKVSSASKDSSQPSKSSAHIIRVYPFASSAGKATEGFKFGGESKAEREEAGKQILKLYSDADGSDGLLDGPLSDGSILGDLAGPKRILEWEGGIIRFDHPMSESGKSPCQWFLGSERKITIEVQAAIPKPSSLLTDSTIGDPLPDQAPLLVGIDVLINQLQSHLSHLSSVLLTGALGAGKTAITQLLAHRLQSETLFHTIYFSCRKLVTDESRVSTIKETFTRIFMAGAWGARHGGKSVVILDDLDKLCPVETELEVGNENGRSRQISEIVCAIVKHYCGRGGGVVLLATAQAKESLHNVIIGGHVVQEIVKLRAPNKEGRRRVMELVVKQNAHEPSSKEPQTSFGSRSTTADGSGSEGEAGAWMDGVSSVSRPSSVSKIDGYVVDPSLDFLDLAGETDGYMPGDLVLLVARARSEALIRSVSINLKDQDMIGISLKREDFAAALKGFTPASLRSVTLQTSTTTFDSIGGLKETRKILLETLQYPTIYAPIFAQCPLRLRSGLLLYGFPGCGKTLLASAVAGECGLNFISVKGPEILNKYIGASEKSVRDLFERAEAARPCVLFFDEFDSIAPKRGHDSTGVTDRVVNQLLTQMDGAEGLSGVYVLAATSRPDLIDPALLRPGRLDKSLLCDLPNLEDRIDILVALGKKLHLSEEIINNSEGGLGEIARRTDGYSGADLQALVYNAHLEAIHDVLGDQKHAEIGSRKKGLGITNGIGHASATKFVQFRYGEDEDRAEAEAMANSGHNKSKILAERAAISAKLEEIKKAKKRGKIAQRGGQEEDGNGIKEEKEQQIVVIRWPHLEKSLQSTRASISAEERRRLEHIYREFVVGRNGEMPSGQGGTEVGGRSSLM